MSHIVSVLVCLLVSASSLPVASTSSQTTTTTTGTSMAHMDHHTKNVGSKGTRVLERSGGKMRLRHTSVLAMKSSAASAGGKEKKSTQMAAKMKKRSVKKLRQRADASPLSSKAPAEFRVYSTLPVPCCAPAGGAPAAPLTPP
eukprot:scaffold1841_cov61-Phaeocystis_antarctica.AAC.2